MKREIEKKMVAELDKKLAGNGLAQVAIKNKDARTLMLLAAQACVGIREVGGNNKGPLVSLIQDTVGGPDAWAWCASFVQTCIAYAELKTGCKSPVLDHEHVLSMWQGTPKSMRVKTSPLPGAIAIWQHGNSQAGHTGFVVGADTKNFTAVEGNTESGIAGDKVVRDGGGVYFTKRSRAGNGNMKVLGFLIPFEKVLPVQPILAPAGQLKTHPKWKSEWTPALQEALEDYAPGLLSAPLEGVYGNRMQFWVMLFSHLCAYEGAFNPKATYKEDFKDGAKANVISRGLFQISIESANQARYGNKFKTAAELHDPVKNIVGAVRIANFLVMDDGMLAGGKHPNWKGMARYWSPFRDPKKKAAILASVKAVS